MNKRVFLFITVLLSLYILIVSCSGNKDNITGQDTQAPSATITSPTHDDTTSGTTTIRVEASDNDIVSKVELLIDGIQHYVDSIAPYVFVVDFSTYGEGSHSVVAKAYDRSGNSGTSNPITIIYIYDFALNGNGYIRIDIIHYKEDGTLDEFSNGDPYFILSLQYGDDTLTDISSVFQNQSELNNPYYHEFDIPDSTKQFYLSIWVYDSDEFDDDWVDYTPDNGKAYKFTYNTTSLPIQKSYNGGTDLIEPEKDCELEFKVSISTY